MYQREWWVMIKKEKDYNEKHTDYRWKCMKPDPEIRKILDRLVAEVMKGEEGHPLEGTRYSKDYPKEFLRAMVFIDTRYKSNAYRNGWRR